jgi:L-asparaginase/Glu-tRNA(Gln) amidotransferase subunit D
MAKETKPSICIINGGGAITEGGTKSNRVALDPRLVSPKLEELYDVAVVDVNRKSTNYSEVPSAIFKRLNKFDGFIVTAPLENLAALGGKLAFSFGPNLSKTISIVGTNIPSRVSHSEAPEMLLRAALAAVGPLREAVVISNDLVVRGACCGMETKIPGTIQYAPFHNDEPLGVFTDGLELKYSREGVDQSVSTFFPVVEGGICGLSSVPRPLEHLDLILTYRGGIIISSGNHTIPEKMGSTPTFHLLKKLQDRKFPVAIVNQFRSSAGMRTEKYPSARIAEEYGAILIPDIEIHTAATKFAWVLRRISEKGLDQDSGKLQQIKDWMGNPYVGELGLKKPFNAFSVA